MPLMLTPAAISQPGPQVSTTTSTSDQNANDVRSFGDAYQHSLANGAVKAPVAKATAPPLDKTSVRTTLRHQADSIDDNPQNSTAALLLAMLPATPTADYSAINAATDPAPVSSQATTAEMQLNQAIAAASGQQSQFYSPGTAGKISPNNASFASGTTADKDGANIAATSTTMPTIDTVTSIAAEPTSAANTQKQGQQALPEGAAAPLAAVSANATPVVTAPDTNSSQQHAQHEHTRQDTRINQLADLTASATTPPSGAKQTIAIAASDASDQRIAPQANQISPGALLALSPTPPAPAISSQQITTPAPVSLALTPQVGSSEWAGALSQQVIFMGNANHQVAELHLNPPDLGPLKVTITMNDNQAQAIFVSGHESVRAAVEAALPQLRTNLADNNINLSHTSVSADTPQQQSTFTQNQDGQPAQRNGQRSNSKAAASSTPLTSTASVSTSQGVIDTFA